MKKIRIILCGYLNYPNAQNINCDNIAKNLDKAKFEVHGLYLGGYPINLEEYKKLGIQLHYVNPHRWIHQATLWKTLTVGNYDIYYMPKLDPAFRWFANHFYRHKLLVSSVEGVITSNSRKWYQDYMVTRMYDIFSISICIAQSVQKYYSIKSTVLPLGVSNIIQPSKNLHNCVQKIIWCGNIVPNKQPSLLLECAKAFPELSFLMIGDGMLYSKIQTEIELQKIENITLTGRIPNHDVYQHMLSSDLLLMTSEFEGLPKVIQEAAQCGLPSIYMANNYTVDFIQDGVNGYAVTSLDEMISKVRYLLEKPDVYQSMSLKAVEVISDYTWEKLIPKYETWFSETLQRYRTEKGI